MHLRLSEDEFATLIDMVSLGAEIASLNQKPGSEDHLASFESLEDKILERGKAQGFGDIIEIEEESGKHRITNEYQQNSYIQDCIDEMRNEVFWEELSFRLAERDILKTQGASAFLKLSEEERIEAVTPLQKSYWTHFSTQGINHIHLVAPREEG